MKTSPKKIIQLNSPVTISFDTCCSTKMPGPILFTSKSKVQPRLISDSAGWPACKLSFCLNIFTQCFSSGDLTNHYNCSTFTVGKKKELQKLNYVRLSKEIVGIFSLGFHNSSRGKDSWRFEVWLASKMCQKGIKVTNVVSSEIMQSQCLPCKDESDGILHSWLVHLLHTERKY